VVDVRFHVGDPANGATGTKDTAARCPGSSSPPRAWCGFHGLNPITNVPGRGGCGTMASRTIRLECRDSCSDEMMRMSSV
jgi:hypothetical protein